MRRNKRNGQPDEGVCDIQYTVHSNGQFVIRQHKRNGQPDEGVCDVQHMVHSDELFVIRQHKKTVSQIKVCVIYGIWFSSINCSDEEEQNKRAAR